MSNHLFFKYFWHVLKRYFTPYIYIIFLLWNFGSVYGQKLTLKISTKDSTNVIFINTLHYQKKHISQASLLSSLDSVKNKLIQKGFLNSSLDTVLRKDSIYLALFDLGRLNEKVRIYYSNKDISKKLLFNITSSVEDTYFTISTEDLPKVLNAIVEIFETQGNSFTQVSLKNIVIKNDLIESSLVIEKSKIRKIDKIVVNGYKTFPKVFLTNYLQLKKSTLFNREKLDKVSELLTILPFVTEVKPPEVLFTKDSTIVYLYLKKKISNKFDGLIGFTSKENGSGISFNGYVDLALKNIFDSGESFSMYWKNNGNDRQVFNLDLEVPYIFNSKFSPSVALNIYKQDSSFINTKTKLFLPYAINERHAIGISLQTENSSNLLTTNNSIDINDFNATFYGVNYNYLIHNRSRLFPVKFNIYTELLTGTKKTIENTNNQTKLFFKAINLWRLGLKSHIFLQNETSTLLSDVILTNELFRIGGVNSIRGFNEESIFASTYSFFNIEYRLNTNASSYLYSITDVGFIDNEITNQSSQTYSLGLGYAFTSKLGIVNLSYAIGEFSDLPFDFNNSRFHIKVISFF